MDTIIVRPRNQKELKLINTFLKERDLRSEVISAEKVRKRKAKEALLKSIPERLKEVELHLRGKIELPTWDEVVKEL
jgi:hypothetical protein